MWRHLVEANECATEQEDPEEFPTVHTSLCLSKPCLLMRLYMTKYEESPSADGCKHSASGVAQV